MKKKSIPSYTIESLKSTGDGARDFDFFRFEYFQKDIEHLKVPHRHHFYTFILVTGGGGKHAIDFKEYELRRGRLFLIAPGQVHAWLNLDKVKGFVVLFNDAFMALSKGRKLMSSWPLFRAHQSSMVSLGAEAEKIWTKELLSLEEEVLNQDEFTKDAIFYAISSLLVLASRLYKKPALNTGVGSNFLFSFQELIEQHYLTLKTPKEYAVRMNITPNYLNALCKKLSGRSAGEFIRQRILLEGKRYLAHTGLSIAEIAFKLGFEDNSYFGRFFKRYTSMTPQAFRDLQN